MFEWYGVDWMKTVTPHDYIPLFSDLSEKEVVRYVKKARDSFSLRLLVESMSALDPVISDLLYIVDHSREGLLTQEGEQSEIFEATAKKKRRLLLTSWQSYGRPSVIAIEKAAAVIKPRLPTAVVLPCALARPYDKSVTHRKYYSKLKSHGIDLKKVHRIVMTALGVLPEELWNRPQVMTYDCGVPDIYRILRLARHYFKEANYSLVIDCIEFPPYKDILGILHREGLIKKIKRPFA